MFGTPRFISLIAAQKDSNVNLIECMFNPLSDFTGQEWEQEDDMTVITLRREAIAAPIQLVKEIVAAGIA